MACKTQHKKISEIPTRQKIHLELEQTDKENITKSILEKYAKASVSMEGSFRYLLLRRYVIRALKIFDLCFLFDRYWSHGELAASIKLERLAEKLNLPKSTVSDHIRQLEKDGVIEVDTIEPSEATDNVQHLVFVLGTCFKGREHWFIDEVFSGSNDKDGNFRPRRNNK